MPWDVWNGQAGDWSVARNWQSGVAPKSGDYIYAASGNIGLNNDATSTSGDVVWMDTTSGSHLNWMLYQSNLGQNSVVLMQGNGGSLELFNSTLLGTIVANQGRSAIKIDAGTYGQNNGNIDTGSYQHPMMMIIDAKGTFSNLGQIYSDQNSTFLTDFYAATMYNSGLMEAASGGILRITSLQPSVTSYGTLYNYGTIMANAGAVQIYSDMTQEGKGSVDVYNNGSVTLGGRVDGGTIQIESGMLDFAAQQFMPVPFASSTFNSTIALVGETAKIVFEGVTNNQIAMEFRPATNDLFVTETLRGSHAQVADLKLTGAAFAAANFTVQGNAIFYNAHPTS